VAAKYIKRSLEPVLKRAAEEFPAAVLTGPRQSGKTTLLKHLFNTKFHYVSMEPPDIRAAAMEDPRGFLEMHPPPVIFDEVQYVPEILPYIKEKIDHHRDIPGQYLLTGSQNILLMEKVTETLAARSAQLLEVKLSSTPRPAMASSIKTFQKDFDDRALPGYVVHPGEGKLPLGSGVTAWPYSQL